MVVQWKTPNRETDKAGYSVNRDSLGNELVSNSIIYIS